jgi:hypothetical protein
MVLETEISGAKKVFLLGFGEDFALDGNRFSKFPRNMAPADLPILRFDVGGRLILWPGLGECLLNGKVTKEKNKIELGDVIQHNGFAPVCVRQIRLEDGSPQGYESALPLRP